MWFIPQKGLSISKDEGVHLHAFHTDTSISYEFKTQARQTEAEHFDSCNQHCQISLPPERIAIYGDNNWRCSILKVIKNALQQKVSPLCVVSDDSIFLTIAIAHLSKTSHVLSFLPGLREKGAQYLKDVAVANGYSIDRVEVLKKKKPQLTMHDTRERKVDLLIGEPFYYGGENMLPWHNLRFWRERSMLDSVLSEDAVIMPCKGILKACAMSLPDLWRSRCSLKDIVGFDHAVVNATLGACGDLPASQQIPCLPFFVWQCGESKKLSEIFTVMEFDFLKPISPCNGEAKAKFTNSGICHGFALWIDWVMDIENSTVISTGLDQRYWKQGVKLLNKPVQVGIHGFSTGECCSTVIEASFDPSGGELVIEHDFREL